jgi:hypothetical protein
MANLQTFLQQTLVRDRVQREEKNFGCGGRSSRQPVTCPRLRSVFREQVKVRGIARERWSGALPRIAVEGAEAKVCQECGFLAPPYEFGPAGVLNQLEKDG